MRFRLHVLIGIIVCFTTMFAVLQAEPQQGGGGIDSTVLEMDRAIMSEIRKNSRLMDNLEYLCDMIGPRLTGSVQMKRANDWTLSKFKEYGLENVHLEKFTINRSWSRGSAVARISAPAIHTLTIASTGWAPGTNGTVRGDVVYVNARSESEFGRYKGKLKNAIVLTSPPAEVPPPKSPKLEGTPTPLPPEESQQGRRRLDPAMFEFLDKLDGLLRAEGVACIFRDARKAHMLLTMDAVTSEFVPGRIPHAIISHEGYALIWRLLKRGKVEVEVNISNTFSEGPVDVYNTVAELPGTEKPDEVVILGAHLDSWDLGTGATDNGTGSMIVLEAARALAASGAKPKRTIRFILFNGEEQGLVGSAEYVKAHSNEMDKISAVLVHDTGTGRVTHIGLHGRYECGEIIDRATTPLRSVGFEGTRPTREGGTDHASFDSVGVPGFYCIQDPAEYDKTHHSQSDTFDKAWKDDLLQGAMVTAVWAYNIASLPEKLPRRPARATCSN